MLQIINLEVEYGDLSVLRGINLEVNSGEILAIVGESGAGKTTLGLSIIGLCTGDVSGQILLNGSNLLSFSEEEKRKIRQQEISMVFQDVAGSLNPVINVFEQVLEPILVHGKPKSAAKEHLAYLFGEVGLDKQIYFKYPHQLSGGEKQRVLIAMALANSLRQHHSHVTHWYPIYFAHQQFFLVFYPQKF